MDFLGFSSEELSSFKGTSVNASELVICEEPMPDLSGLPEDVRLHYLKEREHEMHKRRTRAANIQAHNFRPDLSRSLVAKVDRINRFVKKLKTGGEETGLIEEMESLNLSQYITEAASSMSEAKLNPRDFPLIIELSSKLHQRYAGFSTALVEGLLKQLGVTDPARKRNVMRYLTELLTYGIWNDERGFVRAIEELCKLRKNSKQWAVCLGIISSVIDARGEELTALEPLSKQRRIEAGQLVPLPKQAAVSDRAQARMQKVIQAYFGLSKTLQKDLEAALKEQEDKNMLLKLERSVLDEASTEASLALRNMLAKVNSCLCVLADFLHEEAPELAEIEAKQHIKIDDEDLTNGVFEAVEDREFYQELMDLRRVTEFADEEDCKRRFDGFAQDLFKCISRIKIDDAASRFMEISTKINRQKLVKLLMNVNRNSQNLLPLYSRLVANLHEPYPDITKKLARSLHDEFKELQALKDTNKYESKIKNVRYLGELIKFRLFSSERALDLLETLLTDFTGQNVDLTCQLLVTCGRYLYRLPETRERLAFMLERMQRLKRAKKLSSEIEEQIDYAYFACRPPRAVKVIKEQPQEYKELLALCSAITKDNSDRTIRAIATMPMSYNPYLEKAIFKSLKHGKYSQIYLLANVLSELSKRGAKLAEVKSIVASLQIEIMSQLSINDFRFAQRRILYIRFLGEVYIYRLLSKQKVLDLLYSILYTSPEIDAPDDCFRLKLVGSLLEVCGNYLFSGRYRAKFERYVVHLLAYVYKKTSLSQDVEFMLLDLFEKLRIRTKVPREEIDAALSRAIEIDRLDVKNYDSDSDDPEVFEEVKAEEVRDFEETKEVEEDEDAAFDREFDLMLKQSIEEAKRADRPSDRDLPGYVCNSSPKRNSTDSLEFKLLLKKGHKTTVKKLAVPQDNRLVHQAKARQHKAEEDRKALSQVISSLHARTQADEN